MAMKSVWHTRESPKKPHLMMTHWFSLSMVMLRYMLSASAYTWGGFSY